MKVLGAFTLALIITNAISVNTPPDTLWTKIFGGSNQGGCNNTGDIGRTLERLDDDGYIISGWTNSYGIDNTDVWLICTDETGNEIWSYALTVNDTADEAVYDMARTHDGGFVLTGITDVIYCQGGHGARFACGGRTLLVRINELGDTLWTRSYDGGDQGWSEGKAVQQTDDGGFVIVGRADTEENGSNIWIFKVDEHGNMAWAKMFGDIGYDEGTCVQQTDDGGFIITGSKEEIDTGTQMLWLIRTNELGDSLWTQKYIAGDLSRGRYVLQTDDGGFIIAGIAESWNDNQNKISLIPPLLQRNQALTKTLNIKSSQDGDLMMSEDEAIRNIYLGIKNNLDIPGTVGTEIAHYFTIFLEDSVIQERDAWLVRTNELGEILWDKVIGGAGWDEIYTMSPTSDGGYILAGEKYVEETDSQDMWLIRVNDRGETLWTTTLGDSAYETAYDVQQTSDDGYIVTALKHNRELDVDQTWLVRFGDNIPGPTMPGEQVADKFLLEQNYPNPFNLTTTIRYFIVAPTEIRLRIYDLLGRELKILVNEYQLPGQKSVRWDGTDHNGKNVSTGIYFYQIEAGENLERRKMMLIK